VRKALCFIPKPVKCDSEEKVFFSEEKKQKTFVSLSRVYPAAHHQKTYPDYSPGQPARIDTPPAPVHTMG
jgi:hypothetical protein